MSFNRWGSVVDGVDPVNTTETSISEIRSDGVSIYPDIPDSVVSRPDDNDIAVFDSSDEAGLLINSSDPWPSIGCRLSQNLSAQESAKIIRFSDSTVLDTVDISGLSSGDVFTFDDVDLDPNTDYAIAITASSGWTSGFISGSDTNYPYTSTDGNLSVVDGFFNGSGSNASHNILEVGDLGFD